MGGDRRLRRHCDNQGEDQAGEAEQRCNPHLGTLWLAPAKPLVGRQMGPV
jgi:hypothetical protein